MKKPFYPLTALALLFCSLLFSFKPIADEHATLAIGAQAPDFSLQGVDGKIYTLASFKSSPILMIVFTCDHCPTAQAYEDRIIQITKDYQGKGVAVVAIMPNDPKAIRLDELGYTDLSDSFNEMKIRAAQKHFNFPYLYDGATQSVSHAYGPIATPHVFIFDKDRKLCYSGRIDDVEKPSKTPNVRDTRNALDALLAGKMPDVTTTKVFGCSIKWAEKANWKEKAEREWAKEPTNLDTLSYSGVGALLANKTDSLKVIRIWGVSQILSASQFQDLIDINRMYRARDFQMISLSIDGMAKKRETAGYLYSYTIAITNYLAEKTSSKLIKAADPKWDGRLPLTLVIEPGGKIVYAKQGNVDLYQLKKAIVDDPAIGRYY